MLTAAPLLAERPVSPRVGWGTPASMLIHALALAALAALSLMPRRIEAPEPSSIAVEIVSPEEYRALTTPPSATPVPQPLAAPEGETSSALPADPAAAAPPAGQPAGPITATRFFASDILAHDRRIARALTTLGGDERVVQLCNIEALEQIRVAAPQYAPDTMVAYAMADMDVRGPTLTADGGAFRSRRNWFAIAFTCTVALDFSHVEAFQFTLGAAIPRAEWEEHFLTEAEAEE